MVAGVVAGSLVAVLLMMVSDIHLAAEDGLERLQALTLALLVDRGTVVGKLLDAVHHTVVGDGHTLHAVLDGFVDKMRDLGLAVEDAVMGVDV